MISLLKTLEEHRLMTETTGIPKSGSCQSCIFQCNFFQKIIVGKKNGSNNIHFGAVIYCYQLDLNLGKNYLFLKKNSQKMQKNNGTICE